jgi:hypothetical protein
VCYLNDNAPANVARKFLMAKYDGSVCSNVPVLHSDVVTDFDDFHHIVFSKQGASLQLYVDNVLIDSDIDNTSCGTTNNADLTIGCRGNIVQFFTGKIDDIRIYNRSLAPEEVANLYLE